MILIQNKLMSGDPNGNLERHSLPLHRCDDRTLALALVGQFLATIVRAQSP